MARKALITLTILAYGPFALANSQLGPCPPVAQADYRWANVATVSNPKGLSQKNFQEADFYQAYLQDADLSQLDFSGARFCWAELQGANFVGANLKEANFFQAFAPRAYFQGANLQGANFQDVYVGHADFQRANLTGARFQEAYIGHANFQGANLTDAVLPLESNRGICTIIYNEQTIFPEDFIIAWQRVCQKNFSTKF